MASKTKKLQENSTYTAPALRAVYPGIVPLSFRGGDVMEQTEGVRCGSSCLCVVDCWIGKAQNR